MRLIADLLGLLLPEECFCCGSERTSFEIPLCQACRDQLLREASTLISPISGTVEAISCWEYSGNASKCVKSFKFNKNLRLIPLFAAAITSLNTEYRPEAVIPVPLHKSKLRKRGYNQSALIARSAAEHFGAPLIETCLKKCLNTPDQTGTSRKERADNLNNAFDIEYPGKIAGKKILLVDDVLTTGATIQKCSEILLQKGALEVKGLTLAKTI